MAPGDLTQRQPRPWTRALEVVILALAAHWLLLLNLFWGLYVGLPVLAPILKTLGLDGPAHVIYALYRPACHQRPERSFFLGGRQAVYTTEELSAAGVDTTPEARAIGNQSVGWKVAFCERDLATYGAMLVAGAAYAGVRRRRRVRPLRFGTYLLFLLPIGIDGTLQLFGIYESTWYLRAVTGMLFGAGSVVFAYPYLEEAFRETRAIWGDRAERNG